jgi:hypothetical protein
LLDFISNKHNINKRIISNGSYQDFQDNFDSNPILNNSQIGSNFNSGMGLPLKNLSQEKNSFDSKYHN